MNLNSAILRCKAVIPNADIGEPSAVFNLAVVGCMGVLSADGHSCLWGALLREGSLSLNPHQNHWMGHQNCSNQMGSSMVTLLYFLS